MKMEKSIFQMGALARVILFLVAGCVLLLFPGLSWDIVCLVLGALLIALGVVQVCRFFRRRAGAESHALAVGLTLIATGFVIALMPKVLGGVLHVLMGLTLIAGACLQLETALLLRDLEGKWMIALCGAVLTAVLGVVVLCNPFTEPKLLMRFLGIAMIVEALSDGMDALMLGHIRKKTAGK